MTAGSPIVMFRLCTVHKKMITWLVCSYITELPYRYSLRCNTQLAVREYISFYNQFSETLSVVNITACSPPLHGMIDEGALRRSIHVTFHLVLYSTHTPSCWHWKTNPLTMQTSHRMEINLRTTPSLTVACGACQPRGAA